MSKVPITAASCFPCRFDMSRTAKQSEVNGTEIKNRDCVAHPFSLPAGLARTRTSDASSRANNSRGVIATALRLARRLAAVVGLGPEPEPEPAEVSYVARSRSRGVLVERLLAVLREWVDSDARSAVHWVCRFRRALLSGKTCLDGGEEEDGDEDADAID